MDIQDDSSSSQSSNSNPPASPPPTTPPSFAPSQDLWHTYTPYDSKIEENQIVQGMSAMAIADQSHGCAFEEKVEQGNGNHFQQNEKTPEKNPTIKWGSGFDSPKTTKKEEQEDAGAENEEMFHTPPRRTTIPSLEQLERIARKDREKMKKKKR